MREKTIFKNQKIDFLFSYDGNEWISFFINADNTILSTSSAGGFVGTYVGMYATGNGIDRNNYAFFDWFFYEVLGDFL